jgi:ATP-binding cassette subfamily F protein uup
VHDEMAASASDHERLAALTADLNALAAQRDELESEWLVTSELPS